MNFRLASALTALTLCASASASVAVAGPADRIRSLSEPGGGNEWDTRVTQIMLANHDLDGSGAIDKAPEVDSISCDTFRAMDEGVKEGWSYGLRIIYGFQADKIWIGNAVGFDERVRAYADAAIERCTTVAPRPVHAQIRDAVPGGGGHDAWDKEVASILLANFDSNGSRSIDSTTELMAMSCEVFGALDARVKEGWGYGLRTIYGFEADKIWVGYALGFDESVRSGADLRIAGCTQTQRNPASEVRAVPDGGSSSWDSAVRDILVNAFDADGSGAIDTRREVGSIPADVWVAIDQGVKQRFSYGVRYIYGFDGTAWLGDALGFDKRIRGAADAAMASAGLS